MSLRNDLFKLTSYSVLDIALLKIVGGIIFILLVRILPRADIGIIGLVAGYLVIFRFLSVTPESILLRDFPKIKDRINEHVSAFIVFWTLRTALLLVLGAAFSLIMSYFYGNVVLAIYLFGSIIVLSLGYFQGIIKETHYVSFRQKLVTKINLVFILIQLFLVLLLLHYPNLLLYLGILVGLNITSSLAWFLVLRRNYNFRFSYSRNTFQLIKHSINDFSLWQHFLSSVLYLIYTIDTFVISFFVSLEVIGDYTIALTIANFFFILPQILQKSFVVGFSNIDSKDSVRKSLSIFLRYSFLLSILQLVLYLAVGRLIVNIFTDISVDIIFLYSLFIIVGVTIFNIFRPLNSLITAKTNIRKACFRVYFPAAIFSIAMYFVLTLFFGVMGTAIGNVIAYSFLVLLLALYAKRNLDISLKFKIISGEDREIIRSAIGFKKK